MMLALQNGFHRGSSKRAQRGVTLLELIVVIGILASVMTGLAKWSDMYVESTKETVAGQHMAAVGDAANAYLKDNYATVSAAATATTPVLITVDMLRTTGYLQNGFSVNNNYGQTLCVLVLKPSSTTLLGLVVAEGGTTIADLDLGNVAVAIGAPGGGIYTTATTTIAGAMGGWTTPVGNFANVNTSGKKCDGSTAGAPTLAAGHPFMALWFANGDPSSAFLYRNAVAGHTELNTMNTPLIMASVQTSGAACTNTGAIAQDGTGALLTCQGTWKPSGSAYWKDPVNTFTSLPMTGDNVGSVRMTTDTRRAFMWTGGAWVALAVDQNGNLTVPGTLTAAGGRVIAWNQAAEGGVVQLVGANGQSIYMESNNGTFRLINSPWNQQLLSVDQSGNLTALGNAAAGTLQVNTAVAEGSACSPDGKIAKSSTTSGLILSCQSGVWKQQSPTNVRHVSGHALGDGATVSCGPNERVVACFGGAYSTDGSRIGLDGLWPWGANGCSASGTTTYDEVYVVASCSSY